MSGPAESLADRIVEGAAGLAAFAEGLSEAEWRTPVSGTDARSIGVIVHHVASIYPVEIDVARAIASGKAVTDVTWEAVAELNAPAKMQEQRRPPRSNSCAATAARRPPRCAPSRMMNWTGQRPSL